MKVRWGVLSTARIGTAQVIPAMQSGRYCQIVAIGSRSLEKAQAAASELSIPKAYGSYEELLADPEIDAIYNPLPNHLHVPWSIKALKAGKHVYLEKPICLTHPEAKRLEAAAAKSKGQLFPGHNARFEPEFVQVRKIMKSGTLGRVYLVKLAAMSYSRRDDWQTLMAHGGGLLLNWGAHLVDTAQWGNDTERTGPVTVEGSGKRHAKGLYDSYYQFRVTYTYANGVEMIIDSSGPSIRFEGTDGWVGNKGWRASLHSFFQAGGRPGEIVLRSVEIDQVKQGADIVRVDLSSGVERSFSSVRIAQSGQGYPSLIVGGWVITS